MAKVNAKEIPFRAEARAVMLRHEDDNCGGYFYATGNIRPPAGIQHPTPDQLMMEHKCNKCGKTTFSNRDYPIQLIVPIEPVHNDDKPKIITLN